jgi:Helix-turn-helix domain
VADQKGHRSVSEVAYAVGFKNVSHFSRTFSRLFSVAPRDVRQPARRGAEAASVEATGRETIGAPSPTGAPIPFEAVFQNGAFEPALSDAL